MSSMILILPSYCSAIPQGNVLFWMAEVVSALQLEPPGEKKEEVEYKGFFKKNDAHTSFHFFAGT